MKKCGKCGEFKDLSQFYFDKRKQIHESYCRKCRAQYWKWYTSGIFEPKYEWVPVEEDLPVDNPLNPNESVPVKVKCENINGHKVYYDALYDNILECWVNAKTGYKITMKVIAWTIPRKEN